MSLSAAVFDELSIFPSLTKVKFASWDTEIEERQKREKVFCCHLDKISSSSHRESKVEIGLSKCVIDFSSVGKEKEK